LKAFTTKCFPFLFDVSSISTSWLVGCNKKEFRDLHLFTESEAAEFVSEQTIALKMGKS
jgi:hypothetical protein